MPDEAERRAAKKAVEEQVKAIVPDMFESYITEEHLWIISDAAVWAAEDARRKTLAEKDKTKGGP
jgi:histone H3/H4